MTIKWFLGVFGSSGLRWSNIFVEVLVFKAASLPVGDFFFLALAGSAEAGAASDFLEEVFFLTTSLDGAEGAASSSTSLPNKSYKF